MGKVEVEEEAKEVNVRLKLQSGEIDKMIDDNE
jgi:hypothetical protein